MEKKYVMEVELSPENVDGVGITEIMPALLTLQNDKATFYGRSWCNYGDTSAFFNLARKYDRLDNIMKNALNNGVEKTLHGGDEQESAFDTLCDLAVYSLMWVAYMKDNHPEEWIDFLKKNNLHQFIEE